MIRRICIRLTAFLLALLMGVFLPSCNTKTDIHNPVGEIVVVKSDFDRYVEFLKGLENECQEFSNGFTYKVTAQPVQNGKEACVRLHSVMDGKSSLTDKHYYSIAVDLVIPEGGKNASFSFELSEYKGDGTHTILVQASGVMNTAEYDGTLPAFQEYTASAAEGMEDEAAYLQMAAEEIDFLLIATATMMRNANLTISALGFTYEVQPLESEAPTLPVSGS